MVLLMLPGTNSCIREPVFNEPSNNSIFTNRKTVQLDETKASTTSLIFFARGRSLT